MRRDNQGRGNNTPPKIDNIMSKKEYLKAISGMNKKEKIKLLIEVFDKGLTERDWNFCDYFIDKVVKKMSEHQKDRDNLEIT